MRRITTALLLGICLATVPAARAQVGGVAIGFHNELKTPVIVQGYTLVNGMAKAGMALVILPGKRAIDANVPAGKVRYYRVVDANRPMVQHIRNLPIAVGQQDIPLAIRGTPPNVVIEVAR